MPERPPGDRPAPGSDRPRGGMGDVASPAQDLLQR
jgi:hypothetical protein